ncbi:hypothetical protein ARC20_02500 [Stenotrophomonas panacihumi]|uniref:Uncharacterized protein n=1 Tax=Stenotrophomonas panacihumi TaxID=676599 RepID=A0A0R0B1X7_9GAMM|nr:hypothetical protein [Stenotrophomonas panacihumi]KRG48314.1 hypothetical protein ARC20_02500 [Stenotrophomonas panacihumi]PTN53113.1 hypothetical protein C9J98_17260 [Stenotrophomonas panacihumi]
MKASLWFVPALLALSTPLFAADSTSMHVRLRVVRACDLPLAADGARAQCGNGLPQARGDARLPAPAQLRALTPPSPQQDANEAEFTTYTF